MIPFTIGMSKQEYSVYQVHSHKGKYLNTLPGIFKVESVYFEPKEDIMMLKGVTDSAKTAYNVGNWVGMMHNMYRDMMGEDYTLTVPYTENEN